MKTCNKCFKIKNFSDYYTHKRSADGYGYSCKECLRKKSIEWKQNNKEQFHINEKKYREAARLRDPLPYRKREARRKMRKRNAFVEDVDELAVYEANGWVCQICYQPVDKKLCYFDLMSKSLDHILPLAKGGKHEYANVQLAHWICNVRKHDRTDYVSTL